MDFLEILAKAERLGGTARKEALTKAIISARDHGCKITPGGGKAGGVNVRYGSLKYSVMDINTKGEVFIHIKHHPSKKITDEQREEANDFIAELEGLEIKNGPINHYGQCAIPVEDIPIESLESFLTWAIDTIRVRYYDPHLSGEQNK